jgi:hypothetical protein
VKKMRQNKKARRSKRDKVSKREPLPVAMISSRHREVYHGTQIFKESVRQGWTRNEEA